MPDSLKGRLVRNLSSFLPSRRKKVGLALGSGASRGLSHLGVLEVLSEMGIKIDFIAGTSVGAIVGAFAAAGKTEELNRFLSSLTRNDIFKLIDPVIPRSGLIEGKRIEDILREYFGYIKVEQLDIPFACVATDYNTGMEVILDRGELVEVLRASISIPGIFKPTRIDGMVLLDGGVINQVPVNVVRKMGADFIIAVDLSMRMLETNIFKAVHIGESRGTDKGEELADIPNIFNVIIGSMSIMETTISQMRLKRERPDIVIKPMVDELGLLDYFKYQKGFEEGERAAWESLKRVETFLRRNEKKRITGKGHERKKYVYKGYSKK